ncbi:MAG: lipid-transfer protein [Nevskiaceae bacterium]|nr:MAG: lipid-transfer protein [Nevskiaceae bacterium]TBR74603.1 MAG: lipid-transfer protein [Nevskiaceae bacterium]
MSNEVYVCGVGMIPFAKPGKSEHYPEMAKKAVHEALTNAGVDYRQVQQAYAGYVYGDSTSGQRALYEVGMTGIPIFNVNNNCTSGSTALFLARQAVQSGAVDCVLALGFEEMQPGALGIHFPDRPSPFQHFDEETEKLVGHDEVPLALRYFGGAGKAHMDQFGTKLSTFAKIRVKASHHAARNPLAVFHDLVTEEQVLESKVMWPGVLTRLMCCPPTCGAAAAIVCSEDYAKKHGLDMRVRIKAQAMTTDGPKTFSAHDMREVVGFSMSKAAARQVYEQAGVGPEDLDAVELHDCFCQNELITYEALGLCKIGEAEKFVLDGDNTYGGKVVTNPSGGLLSKGHPLGATGLAQCTELVEQLRGEAGPRQVEGARLALQHNIGIGGACVVTLYERAN